MQFKELFGQKAKYNRLLRLSAPLVMSSSGYVLMQFTDAMFLSWYSPVAIAASGTAGMLSWLTTSLIIGTVSYTGTITANQVGAGQDDKIGSVNWQGLYLALFCGVITAFLGLGTDWFFKVVGHAEELRVLEAEYLKILLFGGALSFAQCSLSGFFSGRADNMRLMIAQLTGQIANVVMDYAMIFGKWGCPEMGVGGAAWATVLSNLFPLSMMLWWFFDHKNAERYKSRSDWRFRWSVAKQLLRFGLPSGFQMCMDAFLWTLFLLVIGRMGTVELAATTIAFRLNQLAFVPIFGVSRAISTLAGQSHGERNYKNALAYMGHGLVLCQIWMTFIAFTFAVFSRQYFMLFRAPLGMKLLSAMIVRSSVISFRVFSEIMISPPIVRDSSRPARLTGSPMQPYFIFRSEPILPTTTEPELTPIPIERSGKPCSRFQAFTSAMAFCMPTAQATASAAWSGILRGAPKTTKIPSPRNSITVPPCRAITADMHSK